MTEMDDSGQRIHHRVRAHVARRWQNTMASDHKTNALIFITIIIAGIFLIGLAYLAMHPIDSFSISDKLTQLSAAAAINAPFECNNRKTITAMFSNREVRISLSDGREITLPQVASASGARYSNSDGSFVFLNKSNTASIQEFGRTTYSGCVTSN